MGQQMKAERLFLRHILATIVYRTAKTFRDTPDNFGAFRPQQESRTPVEILAHMGDLAAWTLSIARGEGRWREAAPAAWENEIARFYATVGELDLFLAGSHPVTCSLERLFQGPFADMLTHAGQLAMLRHLAGAPVRGENYFVADISAGRVGPDQAAPVKLFS
jgi:hypothetical protein